MSLMTLATLIIRWGPVAIMAGAMFINILSIVENGSALAVFLLILDAVLLICMLPR